MKRLFSILFIAFVPGFVLAQTLSVKQLDRKWMRVYEIGCKAFRDNDNQKALESLIEARTLLESNNAENTNSYIFTIMKLAEIYYETGNKKELAKIDNEINEIGKHIHPGSMRYVNYAYNLSLYYSNTEQYQKAIDCIDKSLTDLKDSNATSENIGKFLHRKALCYFCLNDIATAIKTEKLCIEKNETPAYLQAMLFYLFKNGQYSEMDNMMEHCFAISREPVLQKFTFANAAERNTYWSQQRFFFTDYLPFYTVSNPSNVTTSCCYDATLLSKGILLAATNRTTDLISDSNNPQIQASYQRYQQLRGKKERTVDENFEIEALHDTFIKYQANHKQAYRKDFRIRWNDVQQKLGENDVAIEFLQYKTPNGEIEYMALTLKKGYSAPRYTKLCSESQLKSIPSTEFYTSSALYSLIWRPLEEELANTQNVYFSPVGDLYKIGIEYLLNEDGLNMNNLYAFHRLSSTKELVVGHSSSDRKSVVLFGGVDYDAPMAEFSTEVKNYKSNTTEDETEHDISSIQSLTRGDGITYLPGTKREVDDITKLLTSQGYTTTLYNGAKASEVAFKNLGGGDNNILHIATHGFYYNTLSTTQNISAEQRFRDVNLHFVSDEVNLPDEDKMLTHSGLILAGANNTIKNKKLYNNNFEDGIVYANEASTVNLSSVSLLVLSACQSGLGDITDSEGVFGLQRGFKLAGVHSILMSLWKVNDEATCILMTEFYKNVANGMTYSLALSEAQMTLRLTNDGKYDNPEYWAAFVLLDDV